MEREVLAALDQCLPEVFSRRIVSNVMSNLISTTVLANLDSMGRGPRMKFNAGRRVAYENQSLLQWLRGRVYRLDRYNFPVKNEWN